MYNQEDAIPKGINSSNGVNKNLGNTSNLNAEAVKHMAIMHATKSDILNTELSRALQRRLCYPSDKSY